MKSLFIKKLVVFAIISCVFLTSCVKTELDFDNIDTTTSISTSIALPIGSMRFQFGDFIGSNTIPQITIDEEGRYVFMDTLEASEEYHPISMSDLETETSSRWNVADEFGIIKEQLLAAFPQIGIYYPQIKDIDTIPEDGFLVPIEMLLTIFEEESFRFSIDFPIDIDLTLLNKNLDYRRVDSVIVNYADFTSSFTQENFDLPWEDIVSAEIFLSDNFQGLDPILTLPIDGKGYGQEIPINLNDFNLILMKDRTLASGSDNVEDTIHMSIRFTFDLKHNLTFYNDQYIGYNFKVNLINYDAMFGYFAAHELMHDEMVETPLTNLWSGWNMFENWVLPISEPSIRLEVDHTLGVPLLVDLQHLYVTSKDGQRRDATFDAAKQQKSKQIHIDTQIAMDDPLDKTTHAELQLDYTDEWGNIDTLFTIPTHAISYAFAISTDTTSDMQQYRILDNTIVDLKVMMHVPFVFNEGVNLSYSDTITDITISEIDLDSLTNIIPVVDDSLAAQLNLYLVVENGIPFKIEGTFTFLDANNNVVVLNSMPDSTARLTLDYPTSIENGVVKEPSVNHLEIPLDLYQDDFKTISSIKTIVFDAHLGDNLHAVKLTPEASVSIKLGIAADLKAIIDLSGFLNN
ncbi:MAG: hypothetical protein IKY87_06075 [Paludibacteraceae bacterium]|nr:hypothetical protein [Paludibacteraceae bacterium]